jgi:YggT family protein
MDFATGYESFIGVVRTAVFVIAVVVGVIALVDWLVRTRRINPFNPVARFMRQTIDPLMAPVERRIVRAGGMPSAAPWWSLVFVVVGGILVVVLLSFLGGVAASLGQSAARGPSGLLVLLVSWTFGILQLALIVRVISSWFGMSPYSKWIRWSYELTEWLIRPLRQIIPMIGMIDITPIVAYFVLRLLHGLFLSVVGGM